MEELEAIFGSMVKAHSQKATKEADELSDLFGQFVKSAPTHRPSKHGEVKIIRIMTEQEIEQENEQADPPYRFGASKEPADYITYKASIQASEVRKLAKQSQDVYELGGKICERYKLFIPADELGGIIIRALKYNVSSKY